MPKEYAHECSLRVLGNIAAGATPQGQLSSTHLTWDEDQLFSHVPGRPVSGVYERLQRPSMQL